MRVVRLVALLLYFRLYELSVEIFNIAWDSFQTSKNLFLCLNYALHFLVFSLPPSVATLPVPFFWLGHVTTVGNFEYFLLFKWELYHFVMKGYSDHLATLKALNG